MKQYLIDGEWVDRLMEADSVDCLKLIRELKEGKVFVENAEVGVPKPETDKFGVKIDWERKIDWFVGPEDATHVYSPIGFITPSEHSTAWEKWVNNDRFEWKGAWCLYTAQGIRSEMRLAKPS